MEAIDEKKFIIDWYARLCAQARRNENASPSIVCVHCGYQKKDHAHDLRCSAYVCTTNYRAVNLEEVERTQKTLAAIEALANIQGWTLVS